ncbi:MAG: ABC transporter permease [Lachnospiraceae bacterium]|nr:ABC transporter permease [Lachnospiraceae bacterium]
MKVKNQKCIRRLSRKSLYASRKRNLIAIIAIALTTILFTSLFTIVMSINSSFETYQFRQCGGYSHGTFKEVSEEQQAAISAHKNVKETGVRQLIGVSTTGVFGKVAAEISYMDANCTKWSYATPTTGRMPESGKEIMMDTTALALLGVTPELGAEVPLTYNISDKETGIGPEITETFTLVGYWDYDNLMPVHYVNISKEYVQEIEAYAIASGMDMECFRRDLNVMLASSVDIRGQMEEVDTDLGYTWETRDEENSVRIGVNWGYTTAQLGAAFDFGTLVAIIAFMTLVIFTGYLIIYNIFQISVTGDIRFYGLLKTIGVTPRQLRRIIRQQALMLCMIGIPVGLLLGFGIGAILTPAIAKSTIIGDLSTVSASPVIFIGSTAFALVTVLLSCSKPGRIAAKVSPVEATKYTENIQIKKKRRTTRGAKVHQMAFGNLGRNRSKTVLVVISLSLSIVLLDMLYTFVGGFDMEKYLDHNLCSDFIVSTTDYFHYSHVEEFITENTIAQIEANTTQSLAGCGYMIPGYLPQMYMDEEAWLSQVMGMASESDMREAMNRREKRNGKIAQSSLIEGLDSSLMEKLEIVEGDLAPLFDPNSHSIAICVDTDDYGNIKHREMLPNVGDILTTTYVDDYEIIDTRTGEPCDDSTPTEYLDSAITKYHDVDYTVCAHVVLPYSMSFRYYTSGYRAVLPVDALRRDSEREVVPMLYLFDTPDEVAEQAAEDYLASITADAQSTLMYESKATVRAEFTQFQNLFLLLGGVLCAIIGLVGVLNFFNAIMTSILSRLREFAVLQAVGMTNRQLKQMLIYEGLFYALGSVAVSFVLALILNPLAGNLMEDMFWFYNAQRFSFTPILAVIPIFAFLGWFVPTILYGQTTKRSVVERLRESE